MKSPLTSLLTASLLALLALTAPAEAEPPRVVTTIKPLQLIVSAITADVGEPDLLIPSNASYHHFTLKPSSMRSLAGASVVVWVGPELETWLSDVIWQLPDRVDVITVSELDGLTTHPIVDDAVISDGGHGGHGDGRMDPHLWLDFENALVVARRVTDSLSTRDQANAPRYRSNLDRFEQTVRQAHAGQRERLAPLDDREYVVYHNAFQYYEHRHGLSPALVFVQDDEIQPGIRQLRTVRDSLQDLSPTCLLVDVTANPDMIRTVTEGNDLRQVRADTIGASVEPGRTGYLQLLEGITIAFEQCLGDG